MDTKFSTAIHMLIMISEAQEPMTSEIIAKSVGTNASYIRKITGLLKKCGIVESRQGVSGLKLKKSAEDLTLLEILQAVTQKEDIHLFDLHQNPNDECIVGRHIKPVLTDMFKTYETELADSLSKMTLLDCINRIRTKQNEGN